MEQTEIDASFGRECVDAMGWDTTFVEEERLPPAEDTDDPEHEADVLEHQHIAAQQQESSQKPSQLRRSSKLFRIASVWALSCALDLGLLGESSLKEVVIASYSELNSLSTNEDATKSPDLEANDCKGDASKSASIFGNSWPFIDPAQIKQIACTKPVRKRRKKTRWSVKRQRKPKDACPRIGSARTTSLSTMTDTSSSLRGSKRENLGVSHDRSARLSVRKNLSSTRSRVFVAEEDGRLSESYRSSENDDEEEEVISQTTSERSSEEIAPVDYSGSEFYSTSHTKEEEPQNGTESPEYPDYFANVLRIDDNSENNDLDTSEDDTARDDAQTAKFAKFAERRASRKILENQNSPHRTRKASSRKKKLESKNSENCIEMPKRRRNRSVEQREKTHNNSTAYNHYDRRRRSQDLEENSPKSKSDSRDAVAAGNAGMRDVAEEITVQKRKARRRSHNFTNAASCERKSQKDTADALMRDIKEEINMKIEKNVESIGKTISEIEEDILLDWSYKDSSYKDLSQEYDWVDNDESNDRDLSSQALERSFDSTNAEEFVSTVGRRRRRKRYRYSIDCKFDESTETAYRSVFHDCIDFDTPRSTPSLKINMEESWKSAVEDSSDNDDEIHSSWRRSTLESSIEECGNEVDGALLLARKIVSDDSTKDEKCDDEHETLNNACYKYHEMSDTFTAAKNSSLHDSDEDIEFPNQSDDIITYRNKNRTIRRSASMDYSIKDEDDNVKVQGRGPKHPKLSSKINVMRQIPRDKGNNLDDSDKKESGPRRVTRALVKTKNQSKVNHVGKLVWGFFSGWWPALIVDAKHVGMAPVPGKLWVFWIGESQISSLREETQIQPFSRCLEARLSQSQIDKPSRKNVRVHAIDTTIKMLHQRYSGNLTKPYYFWIQRNIDMETLDDLSFYPYPEDIQAKLDEYRERNEKATKKYILSSPEVPPTKKQNVEKNKDTTISWEQIDDERLGLQDQQPGVIAWAKIPGHCWWPAMIIDYRDCCLKEPSFGCQWIMWYGDYQVSEVRHIAFLKFHKGIEKMREYIQNTSKRQPYLEGVLQASKDYCSRLGCNTDNWTLDNVFEYFSNNIHIPNNQLQVSDSNKVYDKYSDMMIKKINEFKFKSDVDAERKRDIKASDDFRRAMSGECDIEKLCLKCLTIPKGKKEEHPFFTGSLCKECSNEFKPCMFVHGNDGKCFYCTVCASTGTVLICDSEECPRVYCTACLKMLICPKSYDEMLNEDPWECFLCRDETKQPEDMIFRRRLNWKEKFAKMFRTTPNLTSDVDVESYKKENRAVRVLSLFDGLSTGFLVLQKLGLVVDVYYASEIDVNALTISSAHFGDRITYLGDVRGITKEKIQEIAPIDLLIGGSPCNDLSLVNPARLGLHDPKGTGILFFEYIRVKKLMEKANKGRHMFWLFENVASMPTEYRLEINKYLGREPDVIDSADFSPQHRLRLYWHNLPFNPYLPLFENSQDVQDKLTPNLNRKALCKKLHTVTGRTGSLLQGKAELKPIIMRGRSDTIWITELEEIFGFPRHYTDVKNLSATNRQKLLGKSWSVQTLTAILRPLCLYFKCNENETSKKSVS
ncbi:DNA methyltransferase 3 isoform X2 [Temnothorax longispinosus]|uniref:DNA methyltransferase 3 isoform X2 n=1 Tax=Temnothorax longispinosus TaxID=300112 RepID=UPI003A98DE80